MDKIITTYFTFLEKLLYHIQFYEYNYYLIIAILKTNFNFWFNISI